MTALHQYDGSKLSNANTIISQDNTILATAIPKITDQFTSLGDVGWYGSVYPLTNCCLTLVFGKLYTFYSTKWVYLTALGIFEIGSLICGATPSSLGLIIGRAIAGLGSCGIYSGSMIILSQSVPLQKRPLCTSLVGGLYGVAGVAGPLLGGAFTDYVSWRWCFYINPLFGAVTALFILLFFDAKEPIKSPGKIKEQILQFDLIGIFFFLPCMITLLLALQWGGQQYNWGNGHIIGLFVSSICLLSIFIVVQWRQKERAMVTLRMIKNKNVWGASLFNFCITGSFLVFSYFVGLFTSFINLIIILTVIIFSCLYGSKASKMCLQQNQA
jgi:MFS family permease